MKLLILNILLPFVISIRITSINKTILCKDCKYFIANKSECALFSEQNLITGKQKFTLAIDARNDECGKDAKFFTKNKYKLFTNTYYFIDEYLLLLVFNYTSLWFAINLLIEMFN